MATCELFTSKDGNSSHFFSFQNKKSPYTFHTRFSFFLLGLHNSQIGQRTKALICNLASGCVCFHTIDKIVWHVLASTKNRQNCEIDKILWHVLESTFKYTFHILRKGQNPFHISHSKVNLES
jgi:hypothetical protein